VLIDRFAPTSNYRERHATPVRAGADRVYQSIESVDFAGSRLILLLLAARGMTGNGPLTLRGFTPFGFVILGENPGTEVVLGVTGRFWRPGGGIRRVDRAEFADFSGPGLMKAVWNFHVEPVGPGSSVVATETRIIATDIRALRSFRPYWLLVRPFSGLIRRRMLALIRADAEGGW
jgi:hypothetical protein